jgi:hypothetical protein
MPMSEWTKVRREHRRRQHPCNVVSTLDLHGLTKEKAISTLTMFLSKILIIATKHRKQQESFTAEPKYTPPPPHNNNNNNYNCKPCVVDYSIAHTRYNPSSTVTTSTNTDAEGIWVHVITGAGRHSGLNGPVLRNAVQKLLEKRCITYRLTNDKGGFLVRVDSGYELYPNDHPLNTKIILANQPKHHNKSSSTYASSCTSSSSSQVDTSTLFDCSFSNPLPSQVHAEIEDVRTAKQLSSHEEQRRQNGLFLQQIQQAVEESFLHSQLDQKRTSSSYHHTTGVEEDDDNGDDYDEDMKRAIQESIQQPHMNCSQEQINKMEEMEMERALAASQLDQEDAEYGRRILTEDDDELLKALSLSLDDKQSITEQELIQIALSKSINEF